MSGSNASARSFAMTCLFRGVTFANQQAQQLRDQSRFRLPFDLERAVEPHQHSRTVLRFGAAQLGARPHARSCLDRCNEAYLVQAVIESGCGVRWNHTELHYHRSDQWQSEIAVRDGASERTFA